MKVHRNAKTTPHMRALLVDRILVQHWRPTAAAEAAGVSVRTVYKWLARYRFAGRGGLEDRSSSPTRQPRRTPPERVAAIVAARHARLTAWAATTSEAGPSSFRADEPYMRAAVRQLPCTSRISGVLSRASLRAASTPAAPQPGPASRGPAR